MNYNFVDAIILQNEVSLLLNDAAKQRWTQAMLDGAYNYAITDWNQRINIPLIIDHTQGWSVEAWTPAVSVYPLPLGIDPHAVRPQFMSEPFSQYGIPSPNTTSEAWADFAKYAVEPPTASTGQWQIRFQSTPYDSPARLLVHVGNTRIPLTPGGHLTLAMLPATAGTNITCAPIWAGSKSGFVMLEQEVVAFAGVQGNDMLNVVRNVDGNGIATHMPGTQVYTVLALEEPQDRAGFVDTVIAACHRMYLNNASSADQNFHQQMVTYYDNRITAFWKRRSQQRSTRFVLTDFSFWN